MANETIDNMVNSDNCNTKTQNYPIKNSVQTYSDNRIFYKVNEIVKQGLEGRIPLPEAARQVVREVNATRVSYKEGKKCTIHNHTFAVDLKLRGLDRKTSKTARELVVLMGFYTMIQLAQTNQRYDPRVDGIEFHGSTENGTVISTKHYRKNFDSYVTEVLAKYHIKQN